MKLPDLPPMPEPAVLKQPADHLGEEYEYTDEAPCKWAWFAHGYDTGMEPFFSAEQVKKLLVALQLATARAVLEQAANLCEHRRDLLLSKQSGQDGDPVDRKLRMAAYLGAEPCADAIRRLMTEPNSAEGEDA